MAAKFLQINNKSKIKHTLFTDNVAITFLFDDSYSCHYYVDVDKRWRKNHV